MSNDAHKCSTTSKNLLPVVLINENSLSECQVEITASKLFMSTLPAINHQLDSDGDDEGRTSKVV